MPEELNSRLLESMRAHGLNPSSLAQRAGISRGTIHQWLARPEMKVRPETLRPVAELLGWPVEDAYRWAGIIPPDAATDDDPIRDVKRAIGGLRLKPVSRAALLHLAEELSRAGDADFQQRVYDAWEEVSGPYAAGDRIPEGDWVQNMGAELMYLLFGVTHSQRPR
jgi:hypothetical protein